MSSGVGEVTKPDAHISGSTMRSVCEVVLSNCSRWCWLVVWSCQQMSGWTMSMLLGAGVVLLCVVGGLGWIDFIMLREE